MKNHVRTAEAKNMMEINKIHCIDALEGIKQIQDKSVDVIITDPPYYIGFNSSATGDKQDWGNHTMLGPLFDFLFKEFTRILKDTGRIFVFTDWRTYPSLYLSAKKFIKVRNMIVWDYGWIKCGSQFRFTHELILHATMPNAKPPKNRSTSDVWRIKPVNYTVKRHHPAEKPVEIIKKMLEETTEKRALIFDPFVGSGTTAVACKELGRNFIGFEIDPNYVEIANQRLREGKQQKVTAQSC